MRTRYVFAKNPSIFLGSGLPLPDDDTPSTMSMRTFFNGILDSLFVEKNPAAAHVCTDVCWQEVQVVIGAKSRNEHVGKAVPRKVYA